MKKKITTVSCIMTWNDF